MRCRGRIVDIDVVRTALFVNFQPVLLRIVGDLHLSILAQPHLRVNGRRLPTALPKRRNRRPG